MTIEQEVTLWRESVEKMYENIRKDWETDNNKFFREQWLAAWAEDSQKYQEEYKAPNSPLCPCPEDWSDGTPFCQACHLPRPR